MTTCQPFRSACRGASSTSCQGVLPTSQHVPACRTIEWLSSDNLSPRRIGARRVWISDGLNGRYGAIAEPAAQELSRGSRVRHVEYCVGSSDPVSPAQAKVKIAFAILLLLHGLIHLMGSAKAFGIADMPQLTQPITKPMGIVWLCAALLFFAATAALFAWPARWWLIGAAAIVVSQVAIVSSWTDARVGTIANAVALVGVIIGFASSGPWSLRAQFQRDVNDGVRRTASMPLLLDADIAALPPAVQRYIRLSGAVGQPRVQNFRARFHGRIRGGPTARWIVFTGSQYNFYDAPSRLFYMDGTMFGIPVKVFHRFIGPSATMRVKLAALFPMVNASGPMMDKAETVTLFNDLCIFAPGALISPNITWHEIDANTVKATFTNLAHTVRAVLSFNDAGELVDFIADGRGAMSADGKSFLEMRWSTPLREYRDFGAHRMASHGDGVWHAPTGNYSYLEFDLDAVEFNVSATSRDGKHTK